MKLIGILKRAKPKKIAKLFFLGLAHPLYIIPTFKATRRCMKISTREYGNLHHQNGPANAFRHALWNFLIAHECFKLHKNKESVVNWTKKITDWHEDAFPNEDLAKSMDLHNNDIGRMLFCKEESHSINHIVTKLKQMATTSIKIDSLSDLKNSKNNLIHIVN